MERKAEIGNVARPTETEYQQQQRDVIVASMKRKKQIKKAFAEYLNDSCGEYQNKIAKELIK
jgi:hypothetical protein